MYVCDVYTDTFPHLRNKHTTCGVPPDSESKNLSFGLSSPYPTTLNIKAKAKLGLCPLEPGEVDEARGESLRGV